MTVELAGVNKRYTGLSTDPKPAGDVLIESYFYETDTLKTFIYGADGWEPWANAVSMSVADGPNVDSFGRLKVSQRNNQFENKNIHGRQRAQWEEPISGAIIVHGAVTGGPFQVAETVTGTDSGTAGTVTAVDAGALTITYTVNHNSFEDGETITGSVSGATAAVTSSNTGSNISHDRDTASVILQVGQGATDSAIRQTHRYFSYLPNNGEDIDISFTLGSTPVNFYRLAGYGDDSNGLFIKQDSTGVYFVIRSSVTGSPVDTEYAQADWNQDKFDGSGSSGINLDFTKEQLFHIDFGWQGKGPVRFGFYDGSRLIFAHVKTFLNEFDVPFMSTPSLPLRYEITNTAATASVNTMKEICSAVVSYGGGTPTGIGFSISNDIAPKSVTSADEVPILAIRLLATHPNGGPNRVTAELSNMSVFPTGNPVHFEIEHIHDPTIDVGATWTAIGGGSAIEYSTNIATITGTEEHRIEEGYVGAGSAGKGGSENEISGDKEDQHRFITQNFDSTNSEVFVIKARGLANADVYSHVSWTEKD